MGKIGAEMVKPFMKDPVQSGCRSALFAATSEDIITDSIRGQYIVPDRQVTAPSSRAQDEEMGERLWSLQEQLLKEKFGQLPYEEIWIMKTHEHRSTQ
jgi:WW domain-containing oxidoreductase